MSRRPMSRREMLEKSIVRGGLVAAAIGMSETGLLAAWQEAEAEALVPTGEEALGPFYKKGAPNVRVLRQPSDPGFPLRVNGRVINTRGEPLPLASVDVWHADFYGLYDLDGYRFRASLQPDRSGDYALETIMPGHYPDRPAQHLHYLVSAPGHRALITQAYFATDPFFEGDPSIDRGLVDSRENIRPVTLYESATGGIAEITFDLVLEGA